MIGRKEQKLIALTARDLSEPDVTALIVEGVYVAEHRVSWRWGVLARRIRRCTRRT